MLETAGGVGPDTKKMRWYVMQEGKTAGPLDGEEIFRQGREGRLSPGMHIRDEAGAWMPILQSPFASVVSSPVAVATHSPSIKRVAIGIPVAVVLLVVLVLLVAAFSSSKTPPPTDTPVVAAAVRPAPEPTREPTIAERLGKTSTLHEAIRLTKPLMGDVQPGDEANPGAALLALWWAHHSDLWPELISMADTKRAEVLKDSEPFRGQRICMTGSVTQIFRDKSSSASKPTYMGVMYHNGGHVRFVTSQSTQGVVEDTPARFCGIVIGLQSYSNVSNGTTHAIQVVGLFDIPANGGRGLPQYDEW
jgi:hypothetical protein